MKQVEELQLELQDTEWPFERVKRHRMIVRAIVIDDEGWFYFVRVHRNDGFGKATLIETSGGGVEPGEELEAAILRELNEELGADAEIICKIGVVSDYYNLIGRHNINNYYLCRARSFGERHLMRDEIEDFHLSTLKLTYDQAVSEYEKSCEFKIGRLIAARELPVLKRAKELMEELGIKEKTMDTIYLAGGCFWGMQMFIDQFGGVLATEVGYANGPDKAPTYKEVCASSGHAETVKIEYDPAVITLEELLEFYFMVIDPLSVNRQGGDCGIQYRTGIFYTGEGQLEVIRKVTAEQEAKLFQPLAVVVEPLKNFFSAEEYHQKYLEKNPGGYCHIPSQMMHIADKTE